MIKRITFLSGLGLIILIITGCAKSTFKQQEQEMIDTYINHWETQLIYLNRVVYIISNYRQAQEDLQLHLIQ